MHILHVPLAYTPVNGGAEIHVQKLSEELACMGHDVSVATTNVGSVDGYFRFNAPTVSHATEKIKGVRVLRVRYGSGVSRRLGAFVAKMPWQRPRIALTGKLWSRFQRNFESKLLSFVQCENPDLIMTMPHLLPNVAASLKVAAQTGKPLVFVPLLHESQQDIDRSAYRRAIDVADAVVANTEFERQTMVSRYGIPSQKVFTGLLGVDIAEDDDATLLVKEGSPKRKVLYLGRIAKSKNIGILVAAMSYLWKEVQDAELVIAGAAGDGTQEVSAILASLRNEDRAKVTFLLNVDNDTKNRLLATSTCLVLPSSNESFGMVLLEAWSFKTPVITLELPVFKEIVDDGADGLLVPPGDVESLAKALQIMLKNTNLARDMGNAGFEKVKRKFRWDQVAARYLEAYRYAIDYKQISSRTLSF